MADTKAAATQTSSSKLWWFGLGAMILALAVYLPTLAGYLFPGESAHLFTQWSGLDVLEKPVNPIWGNIVKMLGGALGSVAALNVFSLVCGVVSAGMICVLVGTFVRNCVTNEDTLPHATAASRIAGIVAGVTFVFSVAVWHTSTHLEYRIFDVFVALALFMLFLPAISRPGLLPLIGAVLGVGAGAFCVDSPIFLPLTVVYLLTLVAVSVKSGRKFYLPAALFLVGWVIGWLFTARTMAAAFLTTPGAEAGGFKDIGDVIVRCIRDYAHEMRQWFGRPGWLFIQLFAVAPFIACAFAAGRGLNNERAWSQYLFHIAMTICAILGYATPLAPEGVMRQYGIEPVATSALVSAFSGYLAAYWLVLWRTRLSVAEAGEQREVPMVALVGRRIAPVALFLFLAVVAFGSLVNSLGCGRDRGAFADICAGEILNGLGERSWLVTDGMLDDHLRAVASARGRHLDLICLQRDMDDAYLKEFSALVKERGLKAGNANLSLSIQLGVLPFLQDWLAGDPDITSKVAIFGVPDFWYMGERTPVPECMFFGGVADVKAVNGAELKKKFDEFWKRVEPVLPGLGKKGSRAIAEVDDPVTMLRLQLRRHVGFLANNLGVTLQDLGMDNEAFALYELVLKEIDRDNISALFNEFEMARAGVKVALAHKVEIERQLKSIVDDSKRRYMLWSLSRYYGYIRSPEVFARMGFAWARSGQTGNAIAQLQRAADFVPADRQTGLLNMMAAVYASGKQSEKSRDVYNKVLEGDANNHDALIGLTRLSLQNGAVNEAREFLTRAVKVAGNDESSGFDRALLALMNNDLAGARLSLQKVTDIRPKSLQAWSLLAGVLLQQHDQSKDAALKKKSLEEIEGVILPKMETLADNPRDYFVQMTRALVWMRKGQSFRKQARDALVVASTSRPDVSVVGDMILNLDIQMDDGDAAEKHARQILRQDRSSKLANYVMGSLRLKEGDNITAETFLRLSVADDHPIAAAQNDLAEVLRRLQRYTEAEKFARDAVRTQPELYVAWETLGATLLDQNKDLDEAENCVKKAIKLAKEINNIEDLRMQITLARVQIAKNDLGHARGTLRTIRTRQKELSKYDLGEFEKLLKATNKNAK